MSGHRPTGEWQLIASLRWDRGRDGTGRDRTGQDRTGQDERRDRTALDGTEDFGKRDGTGRRPKTRRDERQAGTGPNWADDTEGPGSRHEIEWDHFSSMLWHYVFIDDDVSQRLLVLPICLNFPNSSPAVDDDVFSIVAISPASDMSFSRPPSH